MFRLFGGQEARGGGEIAKAMERLSRSATGAIIAVEQGVRLDEYLDTGTPVNATVSAELLATIFGPYSPLHDGAVIVRGNLIVGAGTILPLTQSRLNDRTLGTRHRAALGLSEETRCSRAGRLGGDGGHLPGPARPSRAGSDARQVRTTLCPPTS